MTTLKIKNIRMPEIWFGLVLILVFSGVVWGSNPGDTGYIGKLKLRIAENPPDLISRYELAGIYYDLSGCKEFLAELSLLWTETELRRNDLIRKIPHVSSDASQECQAQLLQIFNINSGNADAPLAGVEIGDAYVMCGDYHLSLGQKDTALWYYAAAERIAPDSRRVLLALADFYLFERLSDKVLTLLQRLEGPEVALRRGEAYLQQEKFQFALAWLLQADPIPDKRRLTRDKDLIKIYLKLGELNRAKELPQPETQKVSSAVYTSIHQELSGLLARMNSAAGGKKSPNQAVHASFTEDGILVRLPVPGKLVAAFYDEDHGASAYIGEQLRLEHLIPKEFSRARLHAGKVELDVWYESEDGAWRKSALFEVLPEQQIEMHLNTRISCDNLITNRRLASLRLTVENQFPDMVEMSIGETGENNVWMPFSEVYSYQLSDSDGEKKILVKFRDRFGNLGESGLVLTLDTSPPQMKSLETLEREGDYVSLTWEGNEKVTTWVRLLSTQCSWEEIPIPAGPDGQFRFSFPKITNLFCQIKMKDEAGNIKIFPLDEANRILGNNGGIRFLINPDPALRIRMAEIRPEFTGENVNTGADASLIWAISNDLAVWSGWHQGVNAVKWRLKPGEGEKFVYIKYTTTDDLDLIKYYVIDVKPLDQESLAQKN